MKELNNKNNNFIRYYYAFFCMLGQPILGMYVIPGTNITFMAVMLVMLLISFLFNSFVDHVVLCDADYIPYFFVIVINTLLSIIAEQNVDITTLVFAAGQYVCYVLVLMLFNRKYFDEYIFYKMLIIGADVSAFYLLIQEGLAMVGIYLPAGIPIFDASNSIVQNYTNASWMNFNFYRPRSLFSEPAMFSTYVLLALLVTHFLIREDSRKTTSALRELLYITTIIICRSTLGYLGLILFLILAIAKLVKDGRIKKWVLICIPIIIFAMYAISKSIFIQYQFNRLSDIDGEQRLKIFSNMSTLDITSAYKFLFGHDFALTTYTGGIFLPSFFRHFYCFGLTGLLALVYFIIAKIKHISKKQYAILFSFIVLMMGSELLHGPMFLLYFSWLVPYRTLFYLDQDTE